MERGNRFRFRRLDAKDVPRMHVIENLCFAMPWSVEALRQEMEENQFALYLGAFLGNELVGYVGIWKILNEAHMTNLAVHPDFRRQGIAKALLVCIKRMAQNAGAMSMTLEVRESNAPARRLYGAMGFVDVGRRKRYYSDNDEDAVIMWCHDLRCHDGEE